MIDIAHLRGLLEKATPGPWIANGTTWVQIVNRTGASLLGDGVYARPNAELCAELRNSAEAMLDEIERGRRIEAAAKELDEYLQANFPYNQVGAGSQLHRRLRAAIATEAKKT